MGCIVLFVCIEIIRTQTKKKSNKNQSDYDDDDDDNNDGYVTYSIEGLAFTQFKDSILLRRLWKKFFVLFCCTSTIQSWVCA